MNLAIAIVLASAGITSAQSTPESLFDGSTLAGWRAERNSQVVAGDGVLRLIGSTGWVLTEKRYYDFILEFEARAAPESKAGVLIRILEGGGHLRGGYEIGLADGRGNAGGLFRHIGKDRRPGLPKAPVHVSLDADWHRFRIECKGNLMAASVDGQVLMRVQGLVHNVGHIGLVLNEGEMRVRNLELSEIAPPERVPPPGVVLADAEGVEMPRVRNEVRPSYTRRSLSEKVQGSVLMEVIIGADGKVGDVWVVRPLVPDLDREAVSAARRWRFHPARKGGIAIPVMATIEMSFTLK